MSKRTPRIFIGSSSENIEIAYSVQSNLKNDGQTLVWDQGVFKLSESSLSSLAEQLKHSDFGIFIFSPDDATILKGQEKRTVRDNVIFEMGMFIGRLGKNRTYMIVPEKIKEMHLPSDLLGITYASYDSQYAEENAIAALQPACTQIRKEIKRLGRFTSEDNEFYFDSAILKRKRQIKSSDSITGLWLSEFKYRAYRNGNWIQGNQYGIEYLQSFNENTIDGNNILFTGNARKVYRHDLRASLFGKSLIGTWDNSSSDNTGCFQLNISSGNNYMIGMHLGNANNGEICEGSWKWAKIDTGENVVDISFVSNLEKYFSLANEEVTEKEMNDAINDDCSIVLESIIVRSERANA